MFVYFSMCNTTSSLSIYCTAARARLYIYVGRCTYIYIYVGTCKLYIFTYTCVCTFKQVYISMYMCIYVCTYSSIYISSFFPGPAVAACAGLYTYICRYIHLGMSIYMCVCFRIRNVQNTVPSWSICRSM